MRTSVIAALLPAAVVLAGCDVQIRDRTPAEYTANHELGIYEIRAAVERGTLVSPTSVAVTAFAGGETVPLTPASEGGEWVGYYSVRCQSGFPLQIRGLWTVQGIITRSRRVPEKPREVRLVEPEPVRAVQVNTRIRRPKGWEALILYRFVTAVSTRITDVRIEPLGEDPESREAAEAVSILTPAPLEARCGTPLAIRLLSKAQHARVALVLELEHPTLSTIRTDVTFAPAGDSPERAEASSSAT